MNLAAGQAAPAAGHRLSLGVSDPKSRSRDFGPEVEPPSIIRQPVAQSLATGFSSHIGKFNKEKCSFLGHLVARSLATVTGI